MQLYHSDSHKRTITESIRIGIVIEPKVAHLPLFKMLFLYREIEMKLKIKNPKNTFSSKQYKDHSF